MKFMPEWSWSQNISINLKSNFPLNFFPLQKRRNFAIDKNILKQKSVCDPTIY